MKAASKRNNSIVQYNCIGEWVVVAKNVDVHYCKEICNFLRTLHPQFKYEYFKNEYITANKDNLNILLCNF
jgi:hypothetical protein